MSILRKAIRHKMAQVLIGSVEAVDERVHVNRILPWQHAELPAIGIYSTGEEQVEDFETQRLLRRARLTVEVVVDAAGGAVDDQVDGIAEQVEQALFACPYLDGILADEMELTDIQGPVIVVDGERPVAVLQVNWLALYLQDTPSEETTPDQALHETHVRWDLTDAENETPEALDVLDTSAP